MMTRIGCLLLIYMRGEKKDNNRVKDLRVLPCIFNDPHPFPCQARNSILATPKIYWNERACGLKELPPYIHCEISGNVYTCKFNPAGVVSSNAIRALSNTSEGKPCPTIPACIVVVS